MVFAATKNARTHCFLEYREFFPGARVHFPVVPGLVTRVEILAARESDFIWIPAGRGHTGQHLM